MADPITDAKLATVLRTFVRGCDPVLPRLREVELSESGRRGPRWPGSKAWAGMTVEERSAWWVSRVGRITSLAASVTGLAGALGDRLPLQDVLGAAGQGLLLCAIAREHGVDDRDTKVRLLARVLFDRDIALSAEVSPAPSPTPPPAGRRWSVKQVATWLWRQGKLLLAGQDELGKRPHGRIYHRALGMLPVVGMLGDYLGERAALKRAARAADRWLHALPPQ